MHNTSMGFLQENAKKKKKYLDGGGGGEFMPEKIAQPPGPLQI